MNHLRKVQVGKGKWPNNVYNHVGQEHAFEGVNDDGWGIYLKLEKWEKEGKTLSEALQLLANKKKFPRLNNKKKGLRSILNKSNKRHISAASKRVTKKTKGGRNTRSRVKSKKVTRKRGGSKPGFHPGVKNNVAKYASYDVKDTYSGCAKGVEVTIPEKYYAYTKDGNDKYGITA